jgi:hypothetical protein
VDGDSLGVLLERGDRLSVVDGGVEALLQQCLGLRLRNADLERKPCGEHRVVQRDAGEVAGRDPSGCFGEQGLQKAPQVEDLGGARLEVERFRGPSW